MPTDNELTPVDLKDEFEVAAALVIHRIMCQVTIHLR